ncbi:MAG: hypothetical protein ABSE20_18835 [Acetobacteraceae bacterium]
MATNVPAAGPTLPGPDWPIRQAVAVTRYPASPQAQTRPGEAAQREAPSIRARPASPGQIRPDQPVRQQAAAAHVPALAPVTMTVAMTPDATAW